MCVTLVPDDWAKGVEHDPFPPSTADQGDWMAHADAEAGNLDEANDRESKTFTIVSRCEARDADLAKQLTKRWWPY